jgi:hypothetical protein
MLRPAGYRSGCGGKMQESIVMQLYLMRRQVHASSVYVVKVLRVDVIEMMVGRG